MSEFDWSNYRYEIREDGIPIKVLGKSIDEAEREIKRLKRKQKFDGHYKRLEMVKYYYIGD